MGIFSMHSIRLFIAVLCLAAAPAWADDEQDAAGLPVPRYVSLKSGEVNMRIGPGTRYSINWVYKREGLPVEIIQEFDQWREIRDSDGTTGWVHKQMLQGKRMAVIKKGTAVLRRAADAQSGPMLRLEPGVVGRLLECEKDWCRLQVSGHKGWIEKTHIWGVYPKEEF
jgi:SH3-like domain-containing protein